MAAYIHIIIIIIIEGDIFIYIGNNPIYTCSPFSSVLEFVCLPWSEVCSARVTSLLLLLLLFIGNNIYKVKAIHISYAIHMIRHLRLVSNTPIYMYMYNCIRYLF